MFFSCRYGINSGVYMPPVGCKMIADGCDPIFVLEKDETRDCTTGKKINLNEKPVQIEPIFPGMLPMFQGMMMPDPTSMFKQGLNFRYNQYMGNGFGDTTTNSLRDFMLNKGLMK